MGIVVIGAVFVDIKGYPLSTYIPGGRNAGRVEQVHGGVSRNVAEDIANVELRPTFVGLVDDTGMGLDVIEKLNNHKVNTRFIQRVPDGMGTWLAIFNNDGDVCAAISKRPDTTPLIGLLEEQGDEIFRDCDSIALELDLEKETVKQTLRYAKKYGKKVYAVVSNMSIAMAGTFCSRSTVLSAISRRPGCSSRTITAIWNRRRCAGCWRPMFGAQTSPAWWSPWATRVQSMPRRTGTAALFRPRRWTSSTPPARAMRSSRAPSSA